MKLFTARHGETTWNAKNIVCGLTDVELTDKGIEQAQHLGQIMADKNIDVIIASPLKRARITAGFVSDRCGVPVIIDERLIEQNYGIYEGVDRYHEGFLSNKRCFAYKYPGGESMMQVAARTYSLIEEVRTKYSDKNVLFVCHGGVCRVINTYFRDMTNDEFFNYSLDNCGYEEYEINE